MVGNEIIIRRSRLLPIYVCLASTLFISLLICLAVSVFGIYTPPGIITLILAGVLTWVAIIYIVYNKPFSKWTAVIDDISIRILVNGVVEESVLLSEIGVVGAYWKSTMPEPIVGFWIKDRSGKLVIDLSIREGWPASDLRAALAFILMKRDRLNFEIHEALRRHLEKYGSVYTGGRGSLMYHLLRLWDRLGE